MKAECHSWMATTMTCTLKFLPAFVSAYQRCCVKMIWVFKWKTKKVITWLLSELYLRSGGFNWQFLWDIVTLWFLLKLLQMWRFPLLTKHIPASCAWTFTVCKNSSIYISFFCPFNMFWTDALFGVLFLNRKLQIKGIWTDTQF